MLEHLELERSQAMLFRHNSLTRRQVALTHSYLLTELHGQYNS